MKLLLHTCCAPCFLKCGEVLEDEGIKPTLFWYNPNIHPWMEYKSRKEIAVTLGVSQQKVDYHINKANDHLRLKLKDYIPLLLLFLN